MYNFEITEMNRFWVNSKWQISVLKSKLTCKATKKIETAFLNIILQTLSLFILIFKIRSIYNAIHMCRVMTDNWQKDPKNKYRFYQSWKVNKTVNKWKYEISKMSEIQIQYLFKTSLFKWILFSSICIVYKV